MSHSSHSRYEEALLGRRYEVALNELIAEQLQDVEEMVRKRNFKAAEGCMEALIERERFRREVLTGEVDPELSDYARKSLDGNVWVRMDRHRMIREGIL